MIKRFFLNVLGFFQLIDHNNRLSITNIATMVVIVKIAMAVSIDWGVISALLITLLNYGHKRHVISKEKCTAKSEDLPFVDLTDITNEVHALASQVKEIGDIAADAKDKASKVALASGLTSKTYGNDSGR